MDKQSNNNCHNHDHNHHHDYGLMSELIHHLPYAIFSLALGLIILSFLDVFGITQGHETHSCSRDVMHGAHLLFHSFHFLHIIFAVTGSLIMFSRFSTKIIKGIIVAIISSVFFCTLSDVILPYFAGILLGVHMHFHLCFYSELNNILPFIAIGLLNGIVMSKHASSLKGVYSVGSHFGHILISSLASLFYLVSEGFGAWYSQMGFLYIFLIIAVVVPCTLADVVVPIYFAKSRKNNEKYKTREYKEIL